MRKKKKQLVFAMLVLGLGVIGANICLTEGRGTEIIRAAETDFVIDDKGVLTKYTGNDKNVVIPDGVTSIGDNAFGYCDSLVSITIPDSVKSIGDYAFSFCKSLVDITIPDGVTEIGGGVFESCSSLANIIIPDSVITIGYSAFGSCESLTSIVIPNNVTTIGGFAFYSCNSLANITISNTVTTIGEAAFSGCNSLVNITIPSSVTTIGDVAFSYCQALEKIKVEAGNKKYEDKSGVLFKKKKSGLSLVKYPPNKKSAKYVIPKKVISIEDSAFWECKKLTDITIPNSVKSIGSNAFYNCSKLTSLTVPDSMTNIQYIYGSFWGCDSLTNLNISVAKDKKISVNIISGEGSQLYKPTVTSKNKKIAAVSMSEYKINETGEASAETVITARKKGKTKIVFKRTKKNGKTAKAVITMTVK